jgi:hypothetical protein
MTASWNIANRRSPNAGLNMDLKEIRPVSAMSLNKSIKYQGKRSTSARKPAKKPNSGK